MSSTTRLRVAGITVFVALAAGVGWKEVQPFLLPGGPKLAALDGEAPVEGAARLVMGADAALLGLNLIPSQDTPEARFVCTLWIQNRPIEEEWSRKVFRQRVIVKGNDGIALPLSAWLHERPDVTRGVSPGSFGTGQRP